MKLMTKSKILLTVLSVLLSWHFLLGQVSTFEKVYDYEGSEQAYSICQTTDGGYVLTGLQFISIGQSKIFITKTDSLGNEEWHKIYGFPFGNHGYTVKQTNDGGYIIGGYTTGDEVNYFFSDAYLLRLNTIGDTLWTKRYGGDGPGFIFDLKLTPDGGFIAAGGQEVEGIRDGYLLKVDSVGNVEWEKTYGGASNDSDHFKAVELVGDTSYVFCGSYHFGIDTSSQVWLLKTDLNGNPEWSQTYGSPFYDFGQGVVLIPEGGFLVAGATAAYDPSLNYDTYLIRTDELGDTLWTHVLVNLNQGSNIRSIKAVGEDGFILGIMNNMSVESIEVELRRIDSEGNIMWRNFFGTETEKQIVNDVILTSDGGFVLTGSDHRTDCLGGCAWLVKTDAEGTLVNIEGPINSLMEMQIYPNPTAGILNIMLPTKTSKGLQLRVYDTIGKLILNKKLPDSHQNYTIDLSGLAEGNYFIQLINEDGTRMTNQIMIQTDR